MDEIHYLIGNKCNLNCEFCFWDQRYPDSNFELKKKIIDEIIKSGIKKVTLSGGEPTLAKDFLKILKYMHSKGLIITLHTNGLTSNKKLATSIARYVSKVGLSFDGSDSEKSKNIRQHKNFFRHTLHVIDLYTNLKKEVNVKTCVTKQNIDDLINIGKILSKKPISYWGLIKYYPVNTKSKNKDKFEITLAEYNSILDKLKLMFPNTTINPKLYSEQKQQYCFIASDGKIHTISKNNEYIVLGDLEKESLNDIIKKI